MKHRSILVIIGFMLFISTKSKADDGAFFSRGEQLFPMQETTIELRHEILRFHYNDETDLMEVDVMFEFYNPGPKKDLLVGFVTPPSSEDFYKNYLLYEGSKSSTQKNPVPTINDFTIFKDGKVLPFKCKLQYSKDKFFISKGDTIKEPDYWTYSFNTTFETGTNIIYHSYSYAGDISDVGVRDFTYRLSTGCQWANKEIGRLELFIDPGKDKLLMLPYSLDSVNNTPLPWEKVGLINSYFGKSMEGNTKKNKSSLYCYSKNGYLHLDEEHVKVNTDLFIAFLTSMVSFYYMREPQHEHFTEDSLTYLYYYPGCSPTKLLSDFHYQYSDTINSTIIDSIVSLNLHQLTILKNIPFALAGYDFKNPELKAYFNQFIWYIPDPNVPDSYNILTPTQRKLVDYVSEQIKLLTKK